MAHKPFEIEVEVKVVDPVTKQPLTDVATNIANAFATAYRGEIGDDESGAHFLSRKLEQHVLDIYQSRAAQEEAAAVSRSITKDIVNASVVKQRKDKPVVVEEPPVEIGNTVPTDK